jgi:hypothetical protein
MQKKSNKNTGNQTEADEPIGIVISRGNRSEEAPRFAAYVWGPVPEAEVGDELVAVA